MLTDDELRESLRTLSAGVPYAPPGRVEASVRRARFMRMRQVATAAVAAAAVAVPAFYVASLSPHRPSLTSPAHWPAIYDADFRPAADKALADWDRQNDLRPGEEVRWLYLGDVPDTDDVAVSFATCREDTCSRVVLVKAHKNEAARAGGNPDAVTWEGVHRTLEPGKPIKPLAVFVDPPRPFAEQGAENVVLVVPAPGTARVTFQTSSFPTRSGSGFGELARQPDGSFAGPIGYVSAKVTVSAYDSEGQLLQTGVVGDHENGTDVGRTLLLDPLTVPAGYQRVSSAQGQVRTGSTRDSSLQRGTQKAFSIFVRCEGTKPLAVHVNLDTHQVPCDGNVARIDGTAEGGEYVTELSGEDPFAAYAYAVGIRSD